MEHNAILFSYDTRVDLIVFWSVLGIGLLIYIIYVAVRKSKISSRELFCVSLIEYVLLMILLTVVFRKAPVYPNGFQVDIFSDKTEITANLFVERAINVLLFFPIGILLSNIIKSHRIIYTVILGLFVSCMIELMQYILNKGVADIEDVMCNGIGLLTGTLLMLIFGKINFFKK